MAGFITEPFVVSLHVINFVISVKRKIEPSVSKIKKLKPS